MVNSKFPLVLRRFTIYSNIDNVTMQSCTKDIAQHTVCDISFNTHTQILKRTLSSIMCRNYREKKPAKAQRRRWPEPQLRPCWGILINTSYSFCNPTYSFSAWTAGKELSETKAVRPSDSVLNMHLETCYRQLNSCLPKNILPRVKYFTAVKTQKLSGSQELVAHNCNHSYLGGWDQEDHGSRPPIAGSLWDSFSTNRWAQWSAPVIAG
jgi:hypothetical protein